VTCGTQAWTYDHVYGGDCGDSLEGLYPQCVAPLLGGLFKGYNATVFAYGTATRACCLQPVTRGGRQLS
jgi:hypothetical protein